MATSEMALEQQVPVKNEGKDENASNQPSTKDIKPKQIIAEKVTGTVKWFNVKSGYGFINRHDTKEDVFVHQTAIVNNNPKKAVRSVGDEEIVEFDVVLGDKGNEAANVSGPNGEPVQGSPYAPDKRRRVRMFQQRRRPNRNDTGGETGGEGDGDNAGGSDDKKRTPRFNRNRRYPRGFRRGGPRRNENGDGVNGEANEGGNTEGEGEAGPQNSRSNNRFPRRRKFQSGPRRPRNIESNNQEGGQHESGDGNENGQKGGRNPPRRRFNRKPKNSGTNQDGGQEVQNTVTESTA